MMDGRTDGRTELLKTLSRFACTACWRAIKPEVVVVVVVIGGCSLKRSRSLVGYLQVCNIGAAARSEAIAAALMSYWAYLLIYI